MRRAAAPLLALALAGCGAQPGARPAADVRDDCAPSVPTTTVALPATLPTPRGTVQADSVRQNGRLLEVRGFVDQAPGEAVDELAALPGAQVLTSERERFDAEVTIALGGRRTAYKLVKACAAGSRFTAVQVAEAP